MKWLKKKKLWIVLAGVPAILLIVQVSTYLAYAYETMPEAGIRSLADYGLLKKKRFVVLEKKMWDVLSEDHQQRLLKEVTGQGQRVYYSMDDVPEGELVTEPITPHDIRSYESMKSQEGYPPEAVAEFKRVIDSGRKIMGIRNGIRIGWELKDSGLFWMRCHSSHYVAAEGAEWREATFIWLLGWWVLLKTERHAMS